MFGSNRALAQKYIASGSLLQGLGRSFVRGLFLCRNCIYRSRIQYIPWLAFKLVAKNLYRLKRNVQMSPHSLDCLCR